MQVLGPGLEDTNILKVLQCFFFHIYDQNF